MLLSSLSKLSRYTGISLEGGNDVHAKRSGLLSWQASISGLVESYCHRRFLIESRTETFNVTPYQTCFHVLGVPIVSITSVKADALGRYDGTSDYTLSSADYRIGVDGFSVVLNTPPAPGYGTIQITYVGGIAYHPVRSVFAAVLSGSPTAGNYCINDSQTAVGIYKATTATTVTAENFYGVFASGDTLSFATTEAALFKSESLLASISAPITAINQQSLSELCPDLERAVEIETRFMDKHKHDFENVSSMNDQTQRRQPTVFQRQYVFQPESLAILGRYRRILL